MLLGIISLFSFWKRNYLIHRSIFLGISVGLIFLGGPWIGGDTAGRFGPMLMIAAAILGSVLVSLLSEKKGKILSICILTLVGISSIAHVYS